MNESINQSIIISNRMNNQSINQSINRQSPPINHYLLFIATVVELASTKLVEVQGLDNTVFATQGKY